MTDTHKPVLFPHTESIWQRYDGPLPTLDGYARGIIAVKPDPDGDTPVVTVQCATCHVTCMDYAYIALKKISFRRAADYAVGDTYLPYRRCHACIAKGKHPPMEGAKL